VVLEPIHSEPPTIYTFYITERPIVLGVTECIGKSQSLHIEQR
jgi:hypothetical protein